MPFQDSHISISIYLGVEFQGCRVLVYSTLVNIADVLKIVVAVYTLITSVCKKYIKAVHYNSSYSIFSTTLGIASILIFILVVM